MAGFVHARALGLSPSSVSQRHASCSFFLARRAAASRRHNRFARVTTPTAEKDSADKPDDRAADKFKAKWTEFAQSFSVLGEAHSLGRKRAAEITPVADNELQETAEGFAKASFAELGTTDALHRLLEPWEKWHKKNTADGDASKAAPPRPRDRNPLDTMKADLQLKVFQALGVGCPVVKRPANQPSFELRDSIFCAGFAFEAYVDPVGGVVMQTPSDTEIHFLSASVVSDYFSKLLVGTVNKIEGLPDDGNVTCRITYGNLSQNEIPPEQVFFLYVLPADAQREALLPLVIEISYGDIWVGRMELPLDQFPPSLTHYELETVPDEKADMFGGELVKVKFELGAFDIGADPGSKSPPTFGDDEPVDEEDDEPLNDTELQLFQMQKLQSRQWDILSKAASRFGVSFKEMQRVAFISDPKVDTQLSVWRSRDMGVVVLAFRGTEQSKWQDFLTDTLVMLQPFTPGGTIDLSRSAYNAGKELSNDDHIKVHYGFLRAYSGVRESITQILRVILADKKPEVFLTGHSLGGALANLCALDMKAIFPDIELQVCSFGAPRVGNAAFANLSNDEVPCNERIVNDADVVARMPRSNFHHAGRTVLVGSEREIWVDNGEDSDRTLKSRWSSLTELWEAERELMKSLLSGRSLDDHMEDSYFTAVVAAHRQTAESDKTEAV